jgi:hypothetical protein
MKDNDDLEWIPGRFTG